MKKVYVNGKLMGMNLDYETFLELTKLWDERGTHWQCFGDRVFVIYTHGDLSFFEEVAA